MTPAEYSAIDAVNWSTLKEMKRSPLHYRHRLRTPRHDESHLAMGRAVHTAVLEPDRFALDYAVYTESKNRGEGSRLRWQAFLAANERKTVLDAEDYAACLAIRDAVRAHPRARRYLQDGLAEQTITWIDRATGLRCKARVDWIASDQGALVDLKTSRSVDPRRFASSSAALLYHGQLAFYLAGCKEAMGLDLDPIIIAVESDPPHDTVVYRLDEEAMDEGEALAAELLREVAERRATGEWPGVDRGAELLLTLPRWAIPDTDAAGADDLGLKFGGAT